MIAAFNASWEKSVYDRPMSPIAIQTSLQTSLQKSTQALFSAAQRLKLRPEWITPWGLMSVHIHGIIKYLFISKTLINTQMSAYLSANKQATRAILALHHLPNIPYSTPTTHAELKDFFSQNHPIVAKPTMGQRAEGVRLIKVPSELAEIDLSGMIFEKYIHGPELRYLVLQGQIIAVQEKVFGGEMYTPENSKRTSVPPEKWNQKLVEMSLKTAEVLGLGFCAVDYKQDEDGKWLVLEVNSAPALWRFEKPDEGPAVPVSELLLKATIAEVERSLLDRQT